MEYIQTPGVRNNCLLLLVGLYKIYLIWYISYMMYLLGVMTGSAVTCISFAVYKIFSPSIKEGKFEASIKVGRNYQSGIVTFKEVK